MLLSVIAGAGITPQEVRDLDTFALERVNSLRRCAVDLLTSEAAIDGIPEATFWAGGEIEPASSDNVRSEMETQRVLGFYQPDTPKRVGTFILSAAVFLIDLSLFSSGGRMASIFASPEYMVNGTTVDN